MRKLVLNILAGVLLTAVFTACGGGGSSTITMTTESRYVGFRLYGSGTATVNWGDGSERVTQTLTEDGVRFRHTYSGASIHTIRISGNNITGTTAFAFITPTAFYPIMQI